MAHFQLGSFLTSPPPLKFKIMLESNTLKSRITALMHTLLHAHMARLQFGSFLVGLVSNWAQF